MPDKCSHNKCDLETYKDPETCSLHYRKNIKNLDRFEKDLLQTIKSGNHDFDEILFPKDYTTFPKNIKLINSKFTGCEFASQFNFEDTIFDKRTVFRENVFSYDIGFQVCQISDDFLLEDNKFIGQLSFTGFKANNGKIRLRNNMQNPTDFPLNEFSFDSCELTKSFLSIENIRCQNGYWNLSFNTFNNSGISIKRLDLLGSFGFYKNDFHESKFISMRVNFIENDFIFYEDNIFNSDSFIEFYGTNFESGRTSFRKFNFSAPTHFERCKFSGIVDFTDSENLSNCLFKNSNIEDINFDGADWTNSFKVRDETILENNYAMDKVGEERKSILRTEYNSASRTYRRLKLNREKQLDYSLSSKFYVREKECLRRSLPKHRRLFHSIMHYTCDYGENLYKVLRTATIATIGFGLIYLFIGFKYKASNEINYDLTLSNINFELGDLGLALWLSAKSILVPLRLLGDFELVSPLGGFLRDLESLIGAFLIGLFVFVFRRQLRN